MSSFERGGGGGGKRRGGVPQHRSGGGHDHKGGGGKGGGGRGSNQEKPKKENIMDLSRYLDKKIRIKYGGGREVVGELKGFDQLFNMVLDNTEETLRDPETNQQTTQKRVLGLVVCRGPPITLISPMDGAEEIENPFY